jgi:hypothetical protein
MAASTVDGYMGSCRVDPHRGHGFVGLDSRVITFDFRAPPSSA